MLQNEVFETMLQNEVFCKWLIKLAGTHFLMGVVISETS